MHPRSTDCILGGTLEEGDWSTEPDPAQTAVILERCTDIAPGLVDAHVIESVAGLRPGRPEVRVEVDDDLMPVPVMHNYGHGGSGITIGVSDQGEIDDRISRASARQFGRRFHLRGRERATAELRGPARHRELATSTDGRDQRSSTSRRS